MSFKRLHIRYIVLLFLTSALLLTECGRKSLDGMIVISEQIDSQEIPDFTTGESWRYIAQSRLIAIDPENPDKSVEILTSDFFSARSPEISYDGTHLLFAARKSSDEQWQIWEMDLRDSGVKQITDSNENSTDPAYLPGGRIVFSRYLQNDSLKAGHTLFTCNLDGTDLRRITFNPHSYFAPSVLKDGRIITISRQVYPAKGNPVIMVMRPDGTKAELFYEGSAGTEIFCRAWETLTGEIVFIETDGAGSGKKNPVSIKYNRPLHSRIDLSPSSKGDFNSVFPVRSGKLLVSFRAENRESYSLYEFDSEKMIPGKEIYSSSYGNITEAVEVAAHERPRKLPSEVDFGVKTGLLLCQNINVTGMTSPESGFSLQLADRIEMIGIDSSLGVVMVENDGSVYLKVAADMPFRIRTLDNRGNIINGPGGWYWLRPNERRGCIGCHEDNEMVPANRYAVAVSKDPITVPVHFTGLKEKEIELE